MADEFTPFDLIGQTGLVRSGDDVLEEWHHKLRGSHGAKVYREMRDNDATIGASFLVIRSLIIQADWRVHPADGSEEAEQVKTFVDECLTDMSHTWEDFLSEVLSMLTFGWAYFEKVFKIRGGDSDDPTRSSAYSDGKIGIRKLAIRGQESLDGWLFDDDGGIRGMYQSASPDYTRRFIPIEKSVLFRTEINKNNPEGRSMLRNAFRSWYFLKRLQETEAIGVERDLVGLPVIHLPFPYLDTQGDTGKRQAAANFAKLLQQIRRNEHEGVLFPAETDDQGKPTGFKLSLLSSGGSRQLDIDESIRRYQKDIAMSVLTQFLFLGMDKVGSFSLSSDQTDLFASALGAVMDTIEQTFNRFVMRDLMELNGIPEPLWPSMRHGDIEKPDMKAVSDTLVNLVNSGLVTPDLGLEAHVRDQAGLPPMDEEEEGPSEDDLEVMTGIPLPDDADMGQMPDDAGLDSAVEES